MVNQICPNCGQSHAPADEVCRHCGFPLKASDTILPSGTLLRGRYEVQQLIHTGGMSYVYLARDKSLFDRSCVIKEVRERIQSAEHRGKLEEEALRMAKLSHPSIAMIFDHFVENDHYFLVVEYVRGKSLSEVYKERHVQLKEAEVVGWGVSICDVVAYIHSEGIIHRDISPDNIMLTEEGSIKFIDFGTLRELRYIAAGKTAGMGKYGYAPPEQWQGRPGPQSDIFALGATLYQLLTGFLPLSKSYLTGQAPQQEDFFPKFPPIRTRNPNVSAHLETILQKALQLDVSERYSSVIQMREDLNKLKLEATTGDSVSPVTVVIPNVPVRLPTRRRANPNNKKGTAKAQDSPDVGGKNRANRTLDWEASESNIRRKTISDTLQHPATLLPLAACAISAGYLVLLSPIFGGGPGAVVLIAISGLAALASYFYHYPKEYLKNTQESMACLESEREDLEAAELDRLIETLQTGFSSLGSVEGTRALEDLYSEYEQLQTALGQHRAADPLSVSVIPALAGEIYRRGLGVLSDALDLMNVVRTPGREKLMREIRVTQQEIEALRDDPGQMERLKLKQEIIASCNERLGVLTKLELWVEQLLYQAHRCEVSLHATRVELATIRAGSTKTSVDSVIEALQERIKQVKEVQDELTKMGY